MENNLEHIDKIFQEKLTEVSVEEKDFSWFEIDKKVSRVNFFRFSWSTFNVFYASLIGLTFLISGWVGLDYFVFEEENTEVFVPEVIQEETVTTVETPKATKKEKVVKPIQKRKSSKPTKNILPEDAVSEPAIAEPVLKSLKPKDTSQISIEPSSKQNSVNTTFIIKPPPVIERDTIVQYKDTSKKKNKKH